MCAQGLQQVQKQVQSLVLAPQLRQSLKILQVPALDLRTAILEELQTNPTLEEMAMDSVSLEDRPGSDDDSGDEQTEMTGDEDFSVLQKLDEEWREYFAQENANRTYTQDDAERRQHFFDSLTSETSLQEYLMQQANLAELDANVRKAFDFLVGSLDDKGFLTSSLNDVALLAQLPLEAVEEAHALLLTLDPVGIGARDLQECLLAQLSAQGKSRSLAATIIRDHYPLLLRRRIPELTRKAGASSDQIHAALEEIAALDPAPGRRFGEDSNRVIVPDVTVERDGDEWVVTLNDEYIPRLRISNLYKHLIAKGAMTRKDKEYLQEKLRSGRFLINSIEQRQQTIERITREILKHQEAFFDEGVAKLRPLTMSRIAEAVGVHETTVSRAIANKYMRTPHGVFAFKFFFTPGYAGKDGEAISNKSVKERIAQIIEGEDPAKPLSDQEVVNLLGREGVKIARRTIAKYREELGILPTNLRRRYA